MITVEQLRSALNYDPETGVFTWRVNSGRARAGKMAGTQDAGYLRIKVGPGRYLAHRLAWLYVHGEWPREEIDHINADGCDNRIANLREANRSQNCANKRVHYNSRTKLKGVYFSGGGRWRATIMVRGRAIYLGTFSSAKDAHDAYAAAAKEHFGEYSRAA